MSVIPPLPRISADLDRQIMVWVKAAAISGRDYTVWRKDSYGNIIRFNAYGDVNSKFGWEIDHIVPKAEGGSDDIDNLQPLQWEANRAKAARLGFLAGLSRRKR